MNKSIAITYFFMSLLMLIILINLVLYPKLNIMIMWMSLMLFSLITALNMNKFMSICLFSYLVFLMMTGGMMVIFTFFLSLISNQLMKTTKKPFIKFLLILLIMFLLLTYLYWYKYKFLLMNFDYCDYLPLIKQFNLNQYLNLKMLYSFLFNRWTIFLISYILFSLLFISNITMTLHKPMRSYKS